MNWQYIIDNTLLCFGGWFVITLTHVSIRGILGQNFNKSQLAQNSDKVFPGKLEQNVFSIVFVLPYALAAMVIAPNLSDRQHYWDTFAILMIIGVVTIFYSVNDFFKTLLRDIETEN